METKKLCALVTGGGKGIGRAISLRMALNAPVLMIGRSEAPLSDTKKAIESAGGEAEYLVLDLRDDDGATLLSAKLEDLGWSVASLILNAGIGKSGPTGSFPRSDFDEIYTVNVAAALPLIQLAIPAMTDRRSGTICFISSIAGIRGVGFDAAYSAAKHAQIGFARSLALEVGKNGICVVPICPGFVASEMTDRSIASLARRKGIGPDAAREQIARTNPQRRIIPAEEVAEMVAFVCSGKVPSLGGSPIILSGGAT